MTLMNCQGSDNLEFGILRLKRILGRQPTDIMRGRGGIFDIIRQRCHLLTKIGMRKTLKKKKIVNLHMVKLETPRIFGNSKIEGQKIHRLLAKLTIAMTCQLNYLAYL